MARISSTPLASARTRARSTEPSASTRARTAATSSARLDTGRLTKAATRICSARSSLTSGTAMAVMVNCGRSITASCTASTSGGGARRRGRARR